MDCRSNVIFIEFSEPVLATVADFTDLRIESSPRDIVGISVLGKHISVSFNGSSALPNATVTIDIAGTIVDTNGNVMGVWYDDFTIDWIS